MDCETPLVEQKEQADRIKSAKVMIVDDVAIMRELIGGYLRNAGFHNLRFAENGSQTLDMIRRELPDILILDLKMPGMSGTDLCDLIRSKPETANLPILIQSATEDPRDRANVFACGANDFVSKPINAGELIARVKMHLENRYYINRLSSFHDRLHKELELARHMQECLLPDPQRIIEMEDRYQVTLASHYVTSSELGGDLWGCWALDEHRFGIFIADVSGHGVGSALNAFRIHATMTRINHDDCEPKEFLARMNDALAQELETGQFATMIYGVIDCREDEFRYASAGSPPPVHMSNKGWRLLESSGLPLGIRSNVDYDARRVALRPGDRLYFYSDALIESPDDRGLIIGLDGIGDMIGAADWKVPVGDAVKRLAGRFHRRQAGRLADDLTIVGIERDP